MAMHKQRRHSTDVPFLSERAMVYFLFNTPAFFQIMVAKVWRLGRSDVSMLGTVQRWLRLW